MAAYVLELLLDLFYPSSPSAFLVSVSDETPPSYTPAWMTQFRNNDTITFLVTDGTDYKDSNQPETRFPNLISFDYSPIEPTGGEQTSPFQGNLTLKNIPMVAGASSIVMPGKPSWSVGPSLSSPLTLTFAGPPPNTPNPARFNLGLNIFDQGYFILGSDDPEIFIGEG